MEENTTVTIQCLMVGLKDPIKGAIQQVVKDAEVSDIPCDLDMIMDIADEFDPVAIFCGSPPPEIPFIELAQMLRMKYPTCATYLIVNSSEKYDRKDVKKNGFTDIFFLPTDHQFMLDEIKAMYSRAAGRSTSFRSVKLIDIEPNEVLEFDTFLYLPANNKHIKYTAAGQPIEGRKLQKLKTSNVTSLYIPEEDMTKFYDYTAKRLINMGKESGLSETQRTQNLKTAVRDIVTNLFSDTVTGTDGGKQIVKDCQEIIRTYITVSNPDSLLKRISAAVGESSDAYTHYSNVSTFAALFGIGLGLPTVEELALAGLLHDIGLARVPGEIQNKPPSERTPEEQAIYEKHCEYSVDLIKERKLVIPDILYKMVMQHHERFDGQGYPTKMPGHKISQEAQILAFADAFDEMTSLASGRARVSPMEAIAHFKQSLSNPSKCFIDPNLLKKIIALFPSTPVDWQSAVA